VSISERGVQNLYEAYSLLLSCTVTDRIVERREQIRANGGMIISLDGVQPERGNETLWVVREVLTGTTLAAKNLVTSDTSSLMELLRPVSELGLPILGERQIRSTYEPAPAPETIFLRNALRGLSLVA